MSAYLHQRDLLFIVETLRPGSAHPEQATGRLQGDETRLETMLDEPRLFQRIMQQKERFFDILSDRRQDLAR